MGYFIVGSSCCILGYYSGKSDGFLNLFDGNTAGLKRMSSRFSKWLLSNLFE